MQQELFSHVFYTMKINRIAIVLVLGLFNIIKVSINAKSFPALYAPHKKGTINEYSSTR